MLQAVGGSSLGLTKRSRGSTTIPRAFDLNEVFSEERVEIRIGAPCRTWIIIVAYQVQHGAIQCRYATIGEYQCPQRHQTPFICSRGGGHCSPAWAISSSAFRRDSISCVSITRNMLSKMDFAALVFAVAGASGSLITAARASTAPTDD